MVAGLCIVFFFLNVLESPPDIRDTDLILLYPLSLKCHLKPTVWLIPLGVVGVLICFCVLPVNRISGLKHEVSIVKNKLSVCSPGILVEGLI